MILDNDHHNLLKNSSQNKEVVCVYKSARVDRFGIT